MPACDTTLTPAELRAHLKKLESLRPRMDELDAKLRRDKAAKEVTIPATALQTVYDQYESARHLVMFEKIGLRLAIQDGDTPCAENHKKLLVEAAKEVERLEGVAHKCQADIATALQKHGFVSLEEALAQRLPADQATTMAQTLVAYGEDLQHTQAALRDLDQH